MKFWPNLMLKVLMKRGCISGFSGPFSVAVKRIVYHQIKTKTTQCVENHKVGYLPIRDASMLSTTQKMMMK